MGVTWVAVELQERVLMVCVCAPVLARVCMCVCVGVCVGVGFARRYPHVPVWDKPKSFF
jgi:hypothetical protein